jgi:hypothetical protein
LHPKVLQAPTRRRRGKISKSSPDDGCRIIKAAYLTLDFYRRRVQFAFLELPRLFVRCCESGRLVASLEERYGHLRFSGFANRTLTASQSSSTSAGPRHGISDDNPSNPRQRPINGSLGARDALRAFDADTTDRSACRER